MLMLLFHLGNSHYALAAREVVEVAPLVSLEPLAKAPEYIAGLFDYRGQHVPVIDLRMLLDGTPCRDFFTTRMILVRFTTASGSTHTLSLLTERVTETVELDQSNFSPTGLAVEDAPYLGEAAQSDQGLIQRIEIGNLLPQSVQAQLFPAGML